MKYVLAGKDLSTAEKPWKSISAGKCLLSECPNSPKVEAVMRQTPNKGS
jgi:hypothetical protein